jgi:hypothetical protein
MKKLLLSLAAISLLGVGALGSSNAFAQAQGPNEGKLVRVMTTGDGTWFREVYVVVQQFSRLEPPLTFGGAPHEPAMIGAGDGLFTGRDVVDNPGGALNQKEGYWLASDTVLRPGARLYFAPEQGPFPWCVDTLPPQTCRSGNSLFRTVVLLNP